jgi:flagellar L-ring protein precursor FlgH
MMECIMNPLRKAFPLLMLAMLAGCNTDPSTNVAQPMTARPTPPVQNAQRDGSIYRVADARPLFEDRRARFVGDTLTVNIVERSSATKSIDESNERTGEVNVSVPTPTIFGLTPKPLRKVPKGFTRGTNIDTSVTADSDISYESAESNQNRNTISGTITVTVTEVLPNGNLAVSGEKQIAINQNTEFIRLSGVVNPININSANAVNSTQLADARIESKGKQSMDAAQIISLMSRFFISLVPF